MESHLHHVQTLLRAKAQVTDSVKHMILREPHVTSYDTHPSEEVVSPEFRSVRARTLHFTSQYYRNPD